MVAYHDAEWGVPLHDERRLFEFLVLDAFQAGLSWRTILHRRDHFRRAFDGFDPNKIAAYDANKVQALLSDPGIIRNRLKVAATVQNAKAFVAAKEEFGTFDAFIWGLAGAPRINRWRRLSQLPARTAESDAMSAVLKASGFTFVGSTICYAFMQAAGMVNDHLVSCFRHAECENMAQAKRKLKRRQ